MRAEFVESIVSLVAALVAGKKTTMVDGVQKIYALCIAENARQAGSKTSKKKKKSSAENGKKGGRPKVKIN